MFLLSAERADVSDMTVIILLIHKQTELQGFRQIKLENESAYLSELRRPLIFVLPVSTGENGGIFFCVPLSEIKVRLRMLACICERQQNDRFIDNLNRPKLLLSFPSRDFPKRLLVRT